MGKIILSEFMTLDGVVQAPGGKKEDTEGGFPYGGWQMPYFDKKSGALMNAFMKRIDGLLLGHTTYNIFSGYWPTASNPDDGGMAKLFNRIPKFVVSTHLKKADWQGTTVLKNISGVENKKKSFHGNLIIFGSSKLSQSLMKKNLIDEYILWLHPLVLGTGKKLFEGKLKKLTLTLVDAEKTDSGIVALTYRRR